MTNLPTDAQIDAQVRDVYTAQGPRGLMQLCRQLLTERAVPKAPTKLPIPPSSVDPLEVVYAEGWNACCDAFFGGLPAPEPLIITLTVPQAPLQAEPAGYFLRAGYSPDGGGTKQWEQVADEFRNDPGVVPLFETAQAEPSDPMDWPLPCDVAGEQAEPVPVVASEPDYDAKQQKTLRAIRSFLSSEYSKDATTPAKIARQRQLGALLDSMDRMQK